jgi:hypothetical protein
MTSEYADENYGAATIFSNRPAPLDGRPTAPSSALTRPSEIGRHNLLECFRLDAEFAQTRRVGVREVVRFEKIHLAGGQRRVGQVLEPPRLSIGHGEGYRHEQAPVTKDAQCDGKSSRNVYTRGPASS